MSSPKRKRRVSQQLMEEDSIGIVRAALPRQWVLREYRPDYGLDLAIETFGRVDDSEDLFESLAEHFFVQVKSLKTFSPRTLKVRPRLNVAKFPLDQAPKDANPKSFEIQVLSVDIETTLLTTVQAMGASVVVHLFVVALDVGRVFFICLSDYIDKIIVPTGAKHLGQGKVAIHVPILNEISRHAQHIRPTELLGFYAKRAKFYSAFNLFAYQHHELAYCENEAARRRMAVHFLQLLDHLDIWEGITWPIVEDYKRWKTHLGSILPELPDTRWFDEHPCLNFFLGTIPQAMPPEYAMDMQIWAFWNGLNVLSRNYEEICREWGLPTYMETLRMA